MRIGVLADSHDHLDRLRRAVARCRQEKVEALLHAGDFVAPFAVALLAGAACPVHAVFGNNDGERLGIRDAFGEWGEVRPGPVELELGDRRVLLMHEPYALASHEESGRYDLVVYGHTHEVDWRPQAGASGDAAHRRRVINPGEVCGWVTGKASFALFDLAAGEAELVELD